jgi:nucleotide-binding universal stress UspA family protein
VLVGVDGSAASLAAVAWAAEEAAALGCELVVLHAWESAYRAVDPASEQARDVTRVDAACALERAVEVAREHTTGSVTSVLIESRPAAALLDAARPGDLVVVGASGNGVVSATLVGSTVNHLLDRSSVPVVVVR